MDPTLSAYFEDPVRIASLMSLDESTVDQDTAEGRRLVRFSRVALEKAVRSLYLKGQTADEQAASTTKEENKIGFSGADAFILSQFAQQIIAAERLRAVYGKLPEEIIDLAGLAAWAWKKGLNKHHSHKDLGTALGEAVKAGLISVEDAAFVVKNAYQDYPARAGKIGSVLTDKQREIARKKMKKYGKQLYKLIHSEGLVA